jgi:prepilin-type N-terminal cleavage/methylation domain-containing protein/prepilin-type processing-associated H-X9-DG protein
MPRRALPVRRGFTLAELLVVLAAVAVLVGLILPVVSVIRRSALRSGCANNLRQVGAACLVYADEYDGVLPAKGNFEDEDPVTSPAWFYRLPPYLEHDNVKGANVFQCAGFNWRGPHVFTHASPKSLKMNSYLDADGRPRCFRLGGVSDAGSLVLFIDAVAGETGMGQWGYAVPSAVDDSRHRGAINVLYADGHGQAVIDTPADRNWRIVMKWRSDEW